ncbi:YciI family protein [Ornithinimicrobium faecis]|uniref:YciI family protein n=1 Tax=Ornithinimicrobium faecis TaxID=2934158 RepID=UPI002117682D|nr:YciI family protein [Ornithinimicrobium sp. HY1745]
MKYVMLAYGTQADWDQGVQYQREHPEDEFGPAQAFAQELIESGEFVYAGGLADPSHTQTVELREGVPVVTDGPYLEAKEFLVSFGIVDVAGHDRAVEIAALMSQAFGRVELRPLDDDGGAAE